jgi:polysaccharide biosynthesis transport protein
MKKAAGCNGLRQETPVLANARDDDQLSLGRILKTLWHRKLLIAGTIGVTVALAMAAIGSLTPRYTADSLLVIAIPDSRSSVSGATSDPGPGRDEPMLRTQVEILRSAALSLQVVRSLGLVSDPEFNQALRPPTMVAETSSRLAVWRAGLATLPGLAWLAEEPPAKEVEDNPAEGKSGAMMEEQRVMGEVLHHLSVESDGKSFALHVSFDSVEPAKAAKILNEFTNTYLRNQVDAKYQAATSAAKWLERKLIDLRQKQLDADRAVQEFRERSTSDEIGSGSQAAPLSSIEIVNLSHDLTEASAARAHAESELREARALSESGGGSVSSTSSPLAAGTLNLRAQLHTLQQRRAELQTKYGEKYPAVIAVTAEIAQTRAALDAEAARVNAALATQVRIEKSREDAIRASMQGLQTEYQQSNRSAIELRQLENEAAAARTVLQTFMTESFKTSAQVEVQQADARILAPAEPPQFPSAPNKRVLIGIAIMGGTILALLAVIVAESFERGLRNSDEIEHAFGLPLLGMIPDHRAKLGSRRAHRILHDPRSLFGESVRAVSTVINVTETAPRARARVILVTSALPREGKTTLAASLARIMAHAGERVLIIDCDLRRPTIQAHFDVSPGPGLTEVLGGSNSVGEVLQIDGVSGVYVMTVGGGADDFHTDFFRPGCFDRLMDGIRDGYDVIVLDCPPVGVVNDSLLLAKFSDAVVLAVQWGVTSRALVRTALGKLKTAKVQPLGIVLTKVNFAQQAAYGFAGDSSAYLDAYFTGRFERTSRIN